MTAAVLGSELATVALCWRIERRDGVTIGFTSHDRDLEIGRLRYRAAPGMLPSAVALSDGLDADMLNVEGALTSDAIRADDLAAGRWDGAAVRLFLVDWERPEGPVVSVAEGEIGDVTVRGAGFEAALRSRAARLVRPPVEQTSPECRAELGDKRCRVDMAARVRIARVGAAIDARSFDIELDGPAADGAFAYGRVRWIGGPNGGTSGAVLSSAGARLVLREAPPFAIAAGDLAELREGCDRSFATCVQRFGNGVNFRGEPHLPGIDLLTRYPGA
ncbi:MAG: DUF2163 domain-containing protein [Allosphingosinicella sp.]|uniref:DUF2163 domain-containing protein n=1 Tax=Allosphingosinicella sp. TaxID=2823234 RepID=UPI0039307A8C